MTLYELIELIERMNVYSAAIAIACISVIVQVMSAVIWIIVKGAFGLILNVIAARIVKHDEIAVGKLKEWYEEDSSPYVAADDPRLHNYTNDGFKRNQHSWRERHSCENCGDYGCAFRVDKVNVCIKDCPEWKPK